MKAGCARETGEACIAHGVTFNAGLEEAMR